MLSREQEGTFPGKVNAITKLECENRPVASKKYYID